MSKYHSIVDNIRSIGIPERGWPDKMRNTPTSEAWWQTNPRWSGDSVGSATSFKHLGAANRGNRLDEK